MALGGVILIFRAFLFIGLCLSSVIIIAVSAHLINFTESFFGNIYYNFSALSLATGLLTLLSLPAITVIDRTRKGAYTSMIAVEIGWLGFLWVMWLASAATTANATGGTLDCSLVVSRFSTACHEIQVTEAFDFINFIFLTGYVGLLLIAAIIAHGKGNTAIWTSAVKDTDFDAAGVPQHTTEAHNDKMSAPAFVANPLPGQGVPIAQPQYPPAHVGHVTPTGSPAPAMSPYPQV